MQWSSIYHMSGIERRLHADRLLSQSGYKTAFYCKKSNVIAIISLDFNDNEIITLRGWAGQAQGFRLFKNGTVFMFYKPRNVNSNTYYFRDLTTNRTICTFRMSKKASFHKFCLFCPVKRKVFDCITMKMHKINAPGIAFSADAVPGVAHYAAVQQSGQVVVYELMSGACRVFSCHTKIFTVCAQLEVLIAREGEWMLSIYDISCAYATPAVSSSLEIRTSQSIAFLIDENTLFIDLFRMFGTFDKSQRNWQFRKRHPLYSKVCGYFRHGYGDLVPALSIFKEEQPDVSLSSSVNEFRQHVNNIDDDIDNKTSWWRRLQRLLLK
ncbi:unnamed protein product [Bursaphelenchus xylophilus]|uniref:(pine wood nematode) hypothetical protein n=1 Tax=Bursaphelenchus xylophilus TaxID=6326 RepID=A0A1I7SEJ7_BURXY|nr:unnamed protein product [Bursaphelenchus xylophilus]CAG9113571.1 unnamed protein product [Bursaphelenchus xylophilus]